MVNLKTTKGNVIAVITVIVLLTSLAAGIMWSQKNKTPQLPKTISNQVKFTAFLPKDLPEGYYIDESSYTVNSGALIVKVNVPNNTVMLLSQQPEPGSFDIGGFHDILKDKQAVETEYGTAYMGKSEDTKIGSLVTSGSWVLISAPPASDTEAMKTILRHLTKL